MVCSMELYYSAINILEKPRNPDVSHLENPELQIHE